MRHTRTAPPLLLKAVPPTTGAGSGTSGLPLNPGFPRRGVSTRRLGVATRRDTWCRSMKRRSVAGVPALAEIVVIALGAQRVARAISTDEIAAPLRDRVDRG